MTARWISLLPVLHLILCLVTESGLLSSEGSWGWFPVFVVDFPFSIALLPLLKVASPILVFGFLGTLWWYALSWCAVYLVGKIADAVRRSYGC
jgi:hypothetical protein